MCSNDETPKSICRNSVCLDNIVFNLFQILSDSIRPVSVTQFKWVFTLKSLFFFVNKVQRIGKQKQQK